MNTTKRTPDPEFEIKLPIIDRMLELYGEERHSWFMATKGRVFHAKEPKEKGRGSKYLTRGHIFQHLQGVYAVCVIGGETSSQFTCFDVDHGGWEIVTQVVNCLVGMGINRDRIYVSTSGGKGYHIEMFYDECVPYAKQRIIYHRMLTTIGVTARDVEFRPTHTQGIKLPLSKHQKTGNWCWYMDKDACKPIEDAEYILSIERMPVEDILAAAAKAEEDANSARITVTEHEPEISFDLSGEEEVEETSTKYEEVDLENLPMITAPGMRHRLVLNIAITCRAEGKTWKETHEILTGWYESQDKRKTHTPISEAVADIDNVVRWVFTKYRPTAWKDGELKKARFTKARVEELLSIRGITPRAIYFQTVAWEGVGRVNRLGEEKMAVMIGTQQQAVNRAKKALIERGVLLVKKGQAVFADGSFTKSRDDLFIGEVKRTVKIPDCKLKAEAGEVAILEMIRDFWRVYFDTLFAIADKDWILSKLDKRERDKLAEIENERTKEHGTQDASEALSA